MGGTTSTPSTPVQVQSGISDPTFDMKTSGVRITVADGAADSKGTASLPVTAVSDNSDKLQQAYTKGKEDGVASFQSSLEMVAAQVYDGVHTRLTEIQTDSIKRSKQMAEELKQKLIVPGSIGEGDNKKLPCMEEQSVFLRCMKEATKNGKSDPLVCKESVDAYARCAMSP